MLPGEKSPGQGVRVLALDYGHAHTGVAICDPTGTIVRPLPDVDHAGTPDGLRNITALALKEDVRVVVVGMPVSLSGELGAQAHETHEFIRALEARLDIEVKVWDERFTSRIAAHKGRYSTASKHSLAACVILEEFLNCQEA